MVTWVCVKESSNIQSGWREGKVNLQKTGENKHQCAVFGLCLLLRYIWFAGLVLQVCAQCLPEHVEHGGEEQLVVDGDAHVARLVEGWGDRPDGGPQGAPPAQEQKLSYGRGKKGRETAMA